VKDEGRRCSLLIKNTSNFGIQNGKQADKLGYVDERSHSCDYGE